MLVGREGIAGLRVLSMPGRRHVQNSYFPLLWQALTAAGVQMISERSKATVMLRYDILHIHLPEVLVAIYSALVGGTLFIGFQTIPRLTRIRERPTDEKLCELIQSIDLVFLPYLRGWNSGFAIFALGSGGRLLCSALPMFRELEEILGPPWVYIFDHNASDLIQELSAAIAHVSQDKPNPIDRARLDQFLAARSFKRATSQQIDLYQTLTSAA
jgi:uncharacterized integral membrane protein